MTDRSRYIFSAKLAAAALAVLVFNPVVSRSLAAETGSGQPTPVEHGQRLLTCGHSFHVFVYPLVAELARSAGIADHQNVGISSIGGSRVIQHWNVPDERNGAKAALKAGKVDVLTLSPIWLPDEGIDNFARLAIEHHPKVRILVQEFWLPNDTYEPKYPLDTRKPVNHNATKLDELAKSNAAYCHDIEQYVRRVNKEIGKDAVLVVPVGEASVALREQIAAGKAPGLKAQWDLFSDTWGHAKAPLQLLAAYCNFAMIYRRSPEGLPVPSVLAKYDGIAEADKKPLNRLLQQIAWETVRHHPLTGLDR